MLRPYRDQDFDLLQKWINSEELLFSFAGTDWSFPLTNEQLQNYRSQHPFKFQYIFCDAAGVALGFAEIITNEPNSPRLGRLLIGNAQGRGKGLGQQMVTELVAEALRLQASPKVFLYVFDHNEPAIFCYQKAGFRFSDEQNFILTHHSQTYVVRKMEYQVW